MCLPMSAAAPRHELLARSPGTDCRQHRGHTAGSAAGQPKMRQVTVKTASGARRISAESSFFDSVLPLVVHGGFKSKCNRNRVHCTRLLHRHSIAPASAGRPACKRRAIPLAAMPGHAVRCTKCVPDPARSLRCPGPRPGRWKAESKVPKHQAGRVGWTVSNPAAQGHCRQNGLDLTGASRQVPLLAALCQQWHQESTKCKLHFRPFGCHGRDRAIFWRCCG